MQKYLQLRLCLFMHCDRVTTVKITVKCLLQIVLTFLMKTLPLMKLT